MENESLFLFSFAHQGTDHSRQGTQWPVAYCQLGRAGENAADVFHQQGPVILYAQDV